MGADGEQMACRICNPPPSWRKKAQPPTLTWKETDTLDLAWVRVLYCLFSTWILKTHVAHPKHSHLVGDRHS